MKFQLRQRTILFLTLVLAIANASHVKAHFPWLASDDKGHAMMWFGESTEDRSYPMPEKVQAIELKHDGAQDAVAMTAVEREDLVGIHSETSIDTNKKLSGTVTYGLYHGMKLTYHVEHLPQQDWAAWPSEPRVDAALQTVVSPLPEGGISVSVLSKGKPVSDTEVKLFNEAGQEEASKKTDGAGIVAFTQSEVKSGLNALMVGIRNADAKGSYEGQDYTSTADYLTATFFKASHGGQTEMTKSKAENPEPKVDANSGVSVKPSRLPELPEELTSFGATIAGRTIYVYGGHTGNAHSYSTEEQSDRLWSLDLSAGKDASWKKLASGPSLQGLALVSFGERIIRIGGFTALNEAGQEQNLQSQTAVASYDPATKVWTAMAPLPEPRSSFDAAVLGNTVYVYGGWKLAGDGEESQWHSTGWSLDLAEPNASWKPTAPLTNKRRAISAAAFDEKLFVIGGMQPDNRPTTRVDVYDPATDSWAQGPAIPGSGMSGFGSAAFATGGKLYVTTMDGFVHQLNAGADAWVTVAKTDPARFFHRMLPSSDSELLMIGGVNMDIGKFTAIDKIEL